MGKALKFRSTHVPRQKGELARLKVIQGPDAGVLFVLNSERVVIGRGENADIMISDLKSSRAHAELVLVNNVWRVRDLGSANGITLNTDSVKEENIYNGDLISLGETSFEFFSSDSGTMLLMSPARSVEQIKSDQNALQDRRDKVRRITEMGALEKPQKKPSMLAAMNQKQKMLIAVGALLAIGVVFFDNESEGPKRTPAQKKDPEFDFRTYLPKVTSPSTQESANRFFHSGFREYVENNYIRARQNFETALQINPHHELARRYLENCKKAIDDEVKLHLRQAKKVREAGKLRSAKSHYEAVLRLLHFDQSNSSYIEAKDQRERMIKQMKEEKL